jgi:queuosine precursor transporter
MFYFSGKQQRSTLFILAIFHLLIITASNYLVQLPISIFGLHTTWGAFSFPFIFLATDLSVRILGAAPARRVIFLSMLPALVLSCLVSGLFFKGSWQGFSGLLHIDSMVLRIAGASFSAYLLGQLLDISVFNRLRQMRRWWLAPSIAMFFGNLSDTFSFFFVAFYQSTDAFMAANWVEIALVDYSYKLLICIIFFLPAYHVLLKKIMARLAALQPLEFNKNSA